MAHDEPRDAAGRPLQQPATDNTAVWVRWSEEVNKELALRASKAEVDATIRSVIATVRSIGTDTTDAILRVSARVKTLTADVEKLKSDYNLMAWIGTTEQRLAQLETRAPQAGPGASVSASEVALMKERLHTALGGTLAELAEKRLGTEQAPAATRRGTNGLSIHGEGRGEVVFPTLPTA